MHLNIFTLIETAYYEINNLTDEKSIECRDNYTTTFIFINGFLQIINLKQSQFVCKLITGKTENEYEHYCSNETNAFTKEDERLSENEIIEI